MQRYFPKPPILAELDGRRHAVLEASAGTGKTYALEHLVVELLLTENVRLEQILVVTFTEKAALELRRRLRDKINQIVTASSESAPSTPHAWSLGPAQLARLDRARASFDSASISTIHAFCQRVLSDHAFDNLRLFSQELVDAKTAFGEAFLEVLRTTFARDQGHREYLAAWLGNDSVDALRDLLFECHQRRGVLRPSFSESTLDAVCRQLSQLALTPHALRPALSRSKLAPSAHGAVLEQIARLASLLKRLQGSGNRAEFLLSVAALEGHGSGLDVLEKRLRDATDRRGKLFQLAEGVALFRAAAPTLEVAVVTRFLPVVLEHLANKKNRAGQLDFDDMLTLFANSLDGPGGDHVTRKLRERFRFALVDEFQDTDDTQWSIFRRLFVESDAGHRLFVIGDPKQAIYSFRGADVFSYLRATETLIARGGVKAHLQENHRSSPNMVAAVNAIFEQSVSEPFFTGKVKYDNPPRAALSEHRGLSQDDLLCAVHIFEIESESDKLAPTVARRLHATRIAVEVERLLGRGASAGARIESKSPRPLVASDIFVLTRTGREGDEVAQILRRHGIGSAFYRQTGLFQTDEALEIFHLLFAIEHLERRAARMRAWVGPFFASEFAAAPVAHVGSADAALAALIPWKKLADAKQYEPLFNQILTDSRLIERELFLSRGERRLTNYLHIFEVLQEEASRTRAPLSELIQTLADFIERRQFPRTEQDAIQRLESDRDAVQIMTMHKSKGLQAEVVFVYGGLDAVPGKTHVYHEEDVRCLYVGAAPPAEAAQEVAEEEQRLLYVACTRARSRLYLPYFPPVQGGDTQRQLPLTGCLRQINSVLDRIVASDHEHFTRERLSDAGSSPQSSTATTADLSSWRPSPFVPVPTADGRPIDRGFIVTSYSQMKSRAEAAAMAEDARLQVIPHDAVALDIPDSGLPAGASTGRFLHEVLEHIDLEVVRGAGGPSELLHHEETAAMFSAASARHQQRDDHLPHAARLVYAALRRPVRLGDVELPEGIASAARIARELEFLYPLPDLEEEGLTNRGFVKGFIDVVLEADERIFFVDWKSDLLANYERSALDEHVKHHYQTQVFVYSEAIARIYGLQSDTEFERRFGGTAYCFVRGMDGGDDPTAGVYFQRTRSRDLAVGVARLFGGRVNLG